MPEQVVMTITGHKTRSMLDRYGHRRRAAAKEAIKQLPALMATTGTDDAACAMLRFCMSTDGQKGARPAIDDHTGASNNAFPPRWGVRVAEGAGLENRYRPSVAKTLRRRAQHAHGADRFTARE